MTTVGSSTGWRSSSISLRLPALVPPIPRGRGLILPSCSSFSSWMMPKLKYSSSQESQPHLSRGLPCTSSTRLFSYRSRTTRTTTKKTIVTNINSNSNGASQSQPSPSISEEMVVYQGVYGPWTIQPSDVQEVVLYRAGLVTSAAAFVIASSTIFLPYDTELGGFLRTNLDLFYAFGAFGLGLSLYLIHIYVTEIKRTLQALWVLGVSGSLVTYASFAQPAGKHLVGYVIQYPTATWLVGPLFAALTGLVFKEEIFSLRVLRDDLEIFISAALKTGLCYGKLEAGILTFVIPAVLLGHLTGLMDEGTKSNLLVIWMALFVIFAGRKFFQPIKDDIGDKSVFVFNSLTEEEKKALINELEQQRNKFES